MKPAFSEVPTVYQHTLRLAHRAQFSQTESLTFSIGVDQYVNVDGGKCVVYWCYADDYPKRTKGGLAVTACVQDGGYKLASHMEIMSALEEGWNECSGKNPNGPAQGTVEAWQSDATFQAFHVWRPDWDLHVSALPSNKDCQINCPADLDYKDFPRPDFLNSGS